MRHVQPWSLPLDVRLMNLLSNILLGVVIVGACVVGIYWVTNKSYFDLRVIYIQSELVHNSPATLRLAIASRIKGNFFTVDLDEVRSVFESAPWVRKVKEIKRVWPYGLSVSLQEYQPVALWGENRQTSHLLDEYGDVFEANVADVEDKQLPLLSGPEQGHANVSLWQMYQRLNARLIVLDWHIDELHLSEQGTWRMVLDDGTQVMIGRGEEAEIENRVTTFASTLPTAMLPYGAHRLLAADLRHANGYALQIDGVKTLAAAALPHTGRRR